MGSQDAPSDSKSKTCSTRTAAARGLAPVEGGKQMRQIVHGDARPRIFYLEDKLLAISQPAHTYTTTGRSILHGVVQQIPQGALQ